ncbi:hypothetical protein PHMEG_00018146 [Phytophthora megakarya]|uniref:Uncharacterized protein n=1 Tax=Phytophthora megakarya TaxID=4795 RepID=A0A225VWA3_9STRA|nr:hypothetical protein PHMEG_00018146 [Phytophthora megakarya]
MSDAKELVAFMKLFLDDVFRPGMQAQMPRRDRDSPTPSCPEERMIASRGAGAILKHLCTLHHSGDLNDGIESHQCLLQAGAVDDPAPGYTQDILELVSK